MCSSVLEKDECCDVVVICCEVSSNGQEEVMSQAETSSKKDPPGTKLVDWIYLPVKIISLTLRRLFTRNLRAADGRLSRSASGLHRHDV